MYYLFLANGFEITEAMAPLDVMRRAGLEVKTVGITGEMIQSSNGVSIKPDIDISDITYDNIDGAIFIA